MGGYNTPEGWFWAMVTIAAACFVMFILCFLMTKEHLKTVSTVSVGSDFKALLSNKPWWLLIGAALCFNLFNTVRGATVAYFFQDIHPCQWFVGGTECVVLFHSLYPYWLLDDVDIPDFDFYPDRYHVSIGVEYVC